ncbi:MAG: N-acetylmuramoyl-L-alanine amidase family protein [Lachnospiraceae bacterium]
MKKISMETILGVLLFAGLGLLFTRGIQKTAGEAVTKEKQAAVTATVVIDAGHGGSDPGKIGINGAREKEVNLAVAEELKACLEEAGIQVVMTRSDAGGLYQESDENKNRRICGRCAIIDEAGAELTVSVHQNSYPAESVRGPRFSIMRSLPKARRRRPASRKP